MIGKHLNVSVQGFIQFKDKQKQDFYDALLKLSLLLFNITTVIKI